MTTWLCPPSPPVTSVGRWGMGAASAGPLSIMEMAGMASLRSDIRTSMVARVHTPQEYRWCASPGRLVKRAGLAEATHRGQHVPADEFELGGIPDIADREDGVHRARAGPRTQPVH